MSAGTLNITIEQGTTFTRTIAVEDDATNPIDLSDVTEVNGQLRKKYSSSVAYDFTLSVTDAVNGMISWVMDAEVSASIAVSNASSCSDWVYDIELVRTDNVERLLEGSATISPEVTR